MKAPLLLVVLALSSSLSGRCAPPAAAPDLLGFWVGEWDVHADGRLDGVDRVESVLGGMALLEHWRGSEGHEGKSWFYFSRPENRWKQVWVTDSGTVKEKVCLGTLPGVGVRFRGEITQPDGRVVTDQTTLTPLPDGTVHQVIEQSLDGGQTWRIGYDAIYRHKATAIPKSP